MQAIRVEHSHYNFPSDHKRRCYGEEQDSSLSLSDQNSVNSINDLDESQDLPTDVVDPRKNVTHDVVDTFSHTLVDKSLLHPGDLDWGFVSDLLKKLRASKLWQIALRFFVDSDKHFNWELYQWGVLVNMEHARIYIELLINYSWRRRTFVPFHVSTKRT